MPTLLWAFPILVCLLLWATLWRAASPYCNGIVKNRYVGRTFIQPTDEMRQLGIRLKLNPLPSVISGQRLVVIDDSIVRGNTSKKLVDMLRSAGAKEVHLRIVSPETRWPCFYGIDTDTQDQLIAANMTNQEMCDFIGCDSLAFISVEGLHEAIQCEHPGFCDACFTGEYPVDIPDTMKAKSFLPEGKAVLGLAASSKACHSASNYGNTLFVSPRTGDLSSRRCYD